MNATASDIAHLLRARKSPRGWSAKCPAHEDRSPSLAISGGRDGKILLHCFAGCTYDAIVDALEARGVSIRAEKVVYDPQVWARAKRQAQRLEDWRRGWEIMLRQAKEKADETDNLDMLAKVAPQLQTLLTSTPAELRAMMQADDRAEAAVQVGIMDRRYSKWLVKQFTAERWGL